MEEEAEPIKHTVATQASGSQGSSPRAGFKGRQRPVADKESSSETSESSSTATSRLSSLYCEEADERCRGDSEDAWLDRMLEQLGLPRYEDITASVSGGAGGAAAGATVPSAEPDLDVLSAEERYHKEVQDVLRTIVLLKVEDMRVAAAQMRSAWKMYERNAKLMDGLMRTSDRALELLKEQLLQLKVENQSLREKVCAAPPP